MIFIEVNEHDKYSYLNESDDQFYLSALKFIKFLIIFPQYLNDSCLEFTVKQMKFGLM